MDVTDALAFIAANHHAVFATTRADGAPQLSPVAVGVLDGAVVVSTRETAVKVRNLERNSAASLCVFTDGFLGPWFQVEGPVEIVRQPSALDLLVAYYRAVSGEHDDWDEYRAAMVRERRVLLRMTPTRVGPTVAG